jgi:hypothetical protein
MKIADVIDYLTELAEYLEEKGINASKEGNYAGAFENFLQSQRIYDICDLLERMVEDGVILHYEHQAK